MRREYDLAAGYVAISIQLNLTCQIRRGMLRAYLAVAPTRDWSDAPSLS